MNIAEKAYAELFPEKIETRKISVVYSGKFKAYNANVKYNQREIIFSLSNSWKRVSEEIQIGLIQGLFLRVFKKKKTTMYIDLYESFIKNISKFAATTKINPVLKESFDRLNKKYFYNFLDIPNLVWGKEALRKIGHYEYATDTIMISSVLLNEFELLDYVMYHEMLHKKLKYNSKNGRNYHHTAEFRRLEREYEDKDAEKKLKLFLRKKNFKKLLKFF